MSGIMLKDLYYFKPVAKQYLLMMGFFTVFSVAVNNPIFIIVMGTTTGINYLFLLLSSDETGGYAFTLSLPFSRKQIVNSKYRMVVLEIVVILLVSNILSGVMSLCFKRSFVEWFHSIVGTVSIFILMAAVLIPVSIKYKVEKAKIVFIGIVMVPVLAFFIIVNIVGSDKIEHILAMIGGINGLGGLVIVSVICLIVSYFISVHLFEKKEF